MNLQKILKAFSITDLRLLRIRRGVCPLHGASLFVRLNDTMLGIRCCFCGAAPIATSIAAVLQAILPDFREKAHYELSSRGPFFEFLRKNVRNLTFSEFMDDVLPGEYKGGVQCQDVQNLTYSDSTFDVVTSTEVFEHVPNDMKGYTEIFRVLKDNGVFIFTVPLFQADRTVTRAVLDKGELKHLLPPTYHDDSIRGAGKVLVFRDYGKDISDRLKQAGFSDVEVEVVPDSGGFGFEREVIVARKRI